MRGNYFHYAFGETLARILPKKAAFLVARMIAGMYPIFYPEDLKTVSGNLRLVLPKNTSEIEIHRLSLKTIENFSYYLVNLFYTDELSLDFIKQSVDVKGLAYLDEAIRKKNGVILASAHIGHWELGGMTLARMGYPLCAVALTHRDPRVNAVFLKRRQKNNFKTIPFEGSLKDCLKVLKEGKVLGLVADRNFGRGLGVEARFLGKVIGFPEGLARLSRGTGAVVLPTFFVMKGFNRYELEIQPPLNAQDEQGMIQTFASRSEAKIRQNPTQWFVFQSFWQAPEWPT